ncbi:pectinesterase inhibitor 6 [Pistacia vera]|uniref:pectinesterase inhibitor 6 n=1 Tax=Pistacia vera TaxID=55513 RepID=UPI00126308DD|nr:pectinesterase inhibitor 6 [Pistacia vera]
MARHSMFIIMAVILLVRLTNYGASAWVNGQNYVRNACSVTTYRDLCIRSLAPFSSTAKTSPIKWARLGVSVTIVEVKSANQYLNNLNKLNCMKGRNRLALLDCIEVFQDTIDELHKSLGILRKLSARNFVRQMDDLTTFMSAALTDENTCLDGFQGQSGRQVNQLKTRVLNSTYFTSNALDLVGKLSTSGFESLNDP